MVKGVECFEVARMFAIIIATPPSKKEKYKSEKFIISN